MNEREELERTLELLRLLRYAFEELKEIQDSLDDRIQELIWKIGKELGEI